MFHMERCQRAIPLFRQIVHELRLSSGRSKAPVSRSEQYIYCLDQFRRHRVTQSLNFKAANELEHLASTYACYLHSTRRLAELRAEYARGERSVEDSAKLVGLKLPQVPQT